MSLEPIHQTNIAYLTKTLPTYSTPELNLDNPQITYFKAGGGNYLYLVLVGNQKYLARVNFYFMKNEWKVKEHEYKVLKILEPLEIAPKAYLYNDQEDTEIGQHWNLIEFIEGENPTEITNELIKQVAEDFSILHTNCRFSHSGDDLPPKDPLPYESDAYNTIANGEDKQTGKFIHLSEFSMVKDLYQGLKEQLGAWFSSLTIFADCTEFYWIHNDNKPENMLIDLHGKIRLID